MKVDPIILAWCHRHFVAPLSQACALGNRAWKGYDDCLAPNRLSLKNKIICWLQSSLLLLLPIFNAMIWAAWKTFGHPTQLLLDPLSPDEEAPSPSRAIPLFPEYVSGPEIKPAEALHYNESVQDINFQTNLTLKHYKNRTVAVAQQGYSQFASHSIYRPDWSLQKLHYQLGTKRCDIWQDEEDPDSDSRKIRAGENQTRLNLF